MKKVITSSIIVAVLLLLNISAFGQGNQNQLHEQFQAAYERTETVLEQAREMIRNSFTKSGEMKLQLAEELQNRAHTNGMNSQYMVGAALTLKARKNATNAMAQNKRDEEAIHLVQRQLERTDELLAQIRSRIQNNNNIANGFFDSARENQKRAWELYHRAQYKASLKLSRKTENMLQNMIERVQSASGNHQRLRNRIQQMEQQMEQYEERMAECDNGEALKLMERARNSFNEGQQLVQNGFPRRAENQFENARHLARRANRICGNGDEIEGELHRLQERARMMYQKAVEQDNDGAKKMLNEAQELLRKAEQSCNQENTEECAAYMKTAQMTIQKANRLMGQ